MTIKVIFVVNFESSDLVVTNLFIWIWKEHQQKWLFWYRYHILIEATSCTLHIKRKSICNNYRWEMYVLLSSNMLENMFGNRFANYGLFSFIHLVPAPLSLYGIRVLYLQNVNLHDHITRFTKNVLLWLNQHCWPAELYLQN